MVIEYYSKNVYGVEKLYIADGKIAEIVRALTGRKTIDARDIQALKSLGLEFKEVIRPQSTYERVDIGQGIIRII